MQSYHENFSREEERKRTGLTMLRIHNMFAQLDLIFLNWKEILQVASRTQRAEFLLWFDSDVCGYFFCNIAFPFGKTWSLLILF